MTLSVSSFRSGGSGYHPADGAFPCVFFILFYSFAQLVNAVVKLFSVA